MTASVACLPPVVGVDAPLAQLGFAERIEVLVAPVVLQDVDDLEHGEVGLRDLRGLHEGQVVRGRVVLGVLPVRRARQPPEGQVEADGVELPLVIAVGGVVADLATSPCDDLRGRAVDAPPTAPRALVHEVARPAQTGQDEPVPETRQHVGGCD